MKRPSRPKEIARKLVRSAVERDPKAREAYLKELDAIGFDELEEFLGETIHTAFRKGSDVPQADVIWHEIREMHGKSWDGVLDWAIWALRVSTGREKK